MNDKISFSANPEIDREYKDLILLSLTNNILLRKTNISDQRKKELIEYVNKQNESYMYLLNLDNEFESDLLKECFKGIEDLIKENNNLSKNL